VFLGVFLLHLHLFNKEFLPLPFFTDSISVFGYDFSGLEAQRIYDESFV